MKRHLTERELIEYQFKLASKGQMSRSAAHLEVCSNCRGRLERLQAKFSALDLLREEVTASDDLTSKVIEQAKEPGPRRVISFKRPAWIGAAAVLAVAVLIFVPLARKAGRVSKPEVAKAPEEADVKDKFATEAEIAKPDVKILIKDQVAIVKPEKVRIVRGVAGAGLAGRKMPADVVSEQPPFAPASAIELVTLPRRDKVQITIYNSADLTLVRERRNLTLKKGWNWLQFMWANTLIDPTSLSLEPLKEADRIDIQQLVFPARLRELGRWLIRSEVSGQVPFEIMYFTSGLSWRAFYMGTLSANERKMNLQGYVRVGNKSGEDYENAQTRLIVGKVHQLDEIAQLAKRRYPYGRPGIRPPMSGIKMDHGREDLLGITDGIRLGRMAGDYRERKKIIKEGLSEYFLYTIEGTETIPDKWGKRLVSFEAENIAVKSLYKYDQERWGRQTIRFVSFANDEEHNLGDTPIPNGKMKIYSQVNEQGHLSYVGGTNIKYIPVDEEVELNLGPARLVTVEPILMNFATENYVFDKKENITGWDEIRTWKIEVANTRELPVKVEITRGFKTSYWDLDSRFRGNDWGERVFYEKHDAKHARFTIEVEPRSKRTFEYTVTTHHGTREESIE